MRSHVLASSGKLRPDTGMGTGTKEVEGQWRKGAQQGLYKYLSTHMVLSGRPMHTVQQLRRGDGCHPHLLCRSEGALQPLADLCHRTTGGPPPQGPFQLDEDGGV